MQKRHQIIFTHNEVPPLHLLITITMIIMTIATSIIILIAITLAISHPSISSYSTASPPKLAYLREGEREGGKN